MRDFRRVPLSKVIVARKERRKVLKEMHFSSGDMNSEFLISAALSCRSPAVSSWIGATRIAMPEPLAPPYRGGAVRQNDRSNSGASSEGIERRAEIFRLCSVSDHKIGVV